jgi:alginate O-acetyltransferase complex protein AlgI
VKELLFNSYEFIFYFLPIVFVVYFLLKRVQVSWLSKVWLVAASLFFYGWWNPKYLILIIGSIVVNFLISKMMLKWRHKQGFILTVGIAFNVALLGYYKYADFFISNVNRVFDTHIGLLQLALPLAISFFTFQQIAFLVDAYRGETKHYSFLSYCFFVTFFPQLIAGPIVHHSEVMGQFEDKKNDKISAKNVGVGLYIFSIGLFKKVMIADTFAIWANQGFNGAYQLTFIDGWITSLAYTFQLYFDFSGYCDMAIGAALLFNIKLPVNFFSPYKATNIQDFWRTWHMTLNRFLTQYVYIPLGGSKKGKVRTYVNIFIVFLVSGFWHGAGWTFIIWGCLHGIASMIYRLWSRLNIQLPKWFAWFITFNFVNAAWVFFRANSIDQALVILKAMLGFNGIVFPAALADIVPPLQHLTSPYGIWGLYDMAVYIGIIFVFLIVILRQRNSIEMMEAFRPTWKHAAFSAVITIITILSLNKVSDFIYFNF